MAEINLADEIAEALRAYTDEIAEGTDKIVKEIGDEAIAKLKETSPKDTGEYSKSWKYKITSKKKGNLKMTLHNAKPWLTHLLENGHVTRNGGRTRPQPHIAPVEKWANEELQKRIEELIK